MRRTIVALLVLATGAVTAGSAGLAAGQEPQTASADAGSTDPTPTTAAATQKIRVRVRRKVRVYGASHARTATWYSTYHGKTNPYNPPVGCDPSGGGGSTSLGTRPRFGEVAVLPDDIALGTHIEFARPVIAPSRLARYARTHPLAAWDVARTHDGRDFVVEDHIGSGSTLDVWLPCSLTGGWDNPQLRFREYRERWRWVTETRVVRGRL